MQLMGKVLLITGIFIAILGLLFIFREHIPFLGKLPGDITLKKDNFTLYFPFISMLLFSLVLTLIINLIIRLLGK
jgi:hypothetical protein